MAFNRAIGLVTDRNVLTFIWDFCYVCIQLESDKEICEM
jgi:hypothetical protein